MNLLTGLCMDPLAAVPGGVCCIMCAVRFACTVPVQVAITICIMLLGHLLYKSCIQPSVILAG
jgi:hypothetical protein